MAFTTTTVSERGGGCDTGVVLSILKALMLTKEMKSASSKTLRK